MVKQLKSKNEVEVFTSFEEENKAENQRRKKMTQKEIFEEFSAIQDRRWGKNWHLKPIVKKVVIEKLPDNADAEELEKHRKN